MKRGYLQELFSKSIDLMPRAFPQPPPSKEVLRLYREVVKFTKQMDWPHPQTNTPYGEMILASAKKEFQIARYEKDPLLVMKMICTTRESINNIKQRMGAKMHSFEQNVHANRMDSLYGHTSKYDELYKSDHKAQEAIRKYQQMNSK